ncbi:MAG: diguanylate cyclase [Spirochaetota bacterium]
MNNRHRFTIAFATSWVDYSYHSIVTRAVVGRSRDREANVIIFPVGSMGASNPVEKVRAQLMRLLASARIDGVIMLTPTIGHYVGPEAVGRWVRNNLTVPVVSMSAELRGIPSVAVDNSGGMEALISHLVEDHGAKRIAYLRGPAEHSDANERFAAYRGMLDHYRLPYDENLVVTEGFVFDSGVHGVRTLRGERRVEFDALLCANDISAYGALTELRREGVVVPGDVLLAGYDGLFRDTLLNHDYYPFATVHQPLVAMAHAAVDSLIDRLEGRPGPDRIRLPVELIVGEGCGCLPPAVREPGREQAAERSDTDCTAGANAEVEELARALAHDDFLSVWRSVISRRQTEGSFPHGLESLLQELGRRAGSRPIASDRSPADRLLEARTILSRSEENERLRFETTRDETRRRTRTALLQLAGSLDLTSLLRTMESAIPSLGVERFFLGIFPGPMSLAPSGDTAEGSTTPDPADTVLIAGHDPRIRDLASELPLSYDSLAILPDRFWLQSFGEAPPEKGRTAPVAVIVEPLVSTGDCLGLLVAEVAGSANVDFDSLGSSVASSLDHARLYEQIRQHRERLEEEVEERTADLVAANKALEREIADRQHAQHQLEEAMEELRRSHANLEYLSQRDELTGLLNRRGFVAAARRRAEQAHDADSQLILFFIDMDHLKAINDSHGHDAGDRSIQAAAEILRATFRRSDIIGRYGGDEFTVLVEQRASEHPERTLRERLRRATARFNEHRAEVFRLSFTIGSDTRSTGDDIEIADMIKRADVSLYRNKRSR